MSTVNYYDVLKVSKTASADEIRNKFRQLARENHPDRFTGAEREKAEVRFQVLTAAMNVLTNPARRKQHDADLQRGTSASQDPKQLAKVYMSHGVKAWQSGDYETARANFDMAVKHDATDAKAWHNLALASAKVPSAVREAVVAAEKAAELEPMNPTYLKDAGLLIMRAGLRIKAQKYLEKALEWSPDDPELLQALGRSGQTSGDQGSKGILDSLFRKG